MRSGDGDRIRLSQLLCGEVESCFDLTHELPANPRCGIAPIGMALRCSGVSVIGASAKVKLFAVKLKAGIFLTEES
jgi:hypothetical protein